MIWFWEWLSVRTIGFQLSHLSKGDLVRNVYMVMNYGDFIVGSTEKADPYMQFLSVTDPAEGISKNRVPMWLTTEMCFQLTLTSLKSD